MNIVTGSILPTNPNPAIIQTQQSHPHTVKIRQAVNKISTHTDRIELTPSQKAFSPSQLRNMSQVLRDVESIEAIDCGLQQIRYQITYKEK